MTGLSLRLPNELVERLEREAQLSQLPRSEVARRALAEWLKAQEHKRHQETMARAAREIYGDPQLASEARQVQEAFDAVDHSLATIEAQERAAGVDPDEKWWD